MEFQKMLGHPGILQNCILGALAKLGMARALRREGTGKLASRYYRDCTAFWGDADREIPILRQAIREHGEMQKLTWK